MLKKKYTSKDLELFLINKKISTLEEMKGFLNTTTDMTVFRKLKELSYCTSYSHGGRYYTLDKTALFDDKGLWKHLTVCFSQYGNLLSTLEHFIHDSKSGYYTNELEAILKVCVKESVLRLVKRGRIVREKIEGRYLYSSKDSAVRKQQILHRRVLISEREGFSNEVKAGIILFVSMLNEQQRRLYAGLESLKTGSGGDHQIAELLGLHPQTVAKGRRELIEQDVELESTRKKGGGRKAIEKKILK